MPDEEQRLWRTMTRTQQQLRRDRVRLQNQREGFLEEMRIRLSRPVSDLPGLGSRRLLQALAEGETDAAKIAALATHGLQASPEALRDARSAAALLNPLRRPVLKLFLERLVLRETQIGTLDKSVAESLQQHQDAVRRLAEVPGLGADSAQQIIAEVGPQAATFPAPDSWRHGWAVVRGGKKVRKSRAATGPRKATGSCGIF